MFVPIVSLGMKQIGNRIRFGINTRQVRSLVQIAIDTGKREVVEIISPAVMETPLRRLSLPRALQAGAAGYLLKGAPAAAPGRFRSPPCGFEHRLQRRRGV